MRNQPRKASWPTHRAAKHRASARGASLRRSQRAQSQAGRAKNQAIAAVKISIRKPASNTEAPPKW
ncbi:hypothetical protein D3C80_1432880 [compost metagenome]